MQRDGENGWKKREALVMKEVYTALTIAGTDPSGGAGIQADLKTFQELEVYGMSVITAVVSQNTMGVKMYLDMPLELIESQIDAVFEDIPPHAVKTGMLSRTPVIELVAAKLKQYRVQHYVMDPVMVAKSGDPLVAEDARRKLAEVLLPLCEVVTPNLPEAEVLLGREIRDLPAMRDAAKRLVEEYGVKVAVVKGGHLDGEARDVIYDGSVMEELAAPKVKTPHTHGTGCTFSAAITAQLAKGASVFESVALAKEFITCAVRDTLGIGKGHGPTNHWAYRQQR